MKKCKECHKMVYRKYNESSKYFVKKKFCSRKCTFKNLPGTKKTGIYKKCITCLKEFYVKKCYTNYLKNCSRKCFGKWMSKNRIGNKSANWKGGIVVDKAGYIYIHKPEHPNSNSLGYVFLHRLIMENKIGRLLTSKEVIHHIDENPSNNKISNLMLFTSNGEHLKYHKK